MMMMSCWIALVLVWLLSSSTLFLLLLCDGINGDHVVVCGEKERAALLSFKQALNDPSNRLSSWSSLPQLNDCCTWTGVRCSNVTGRIIGLHLSNPYFHYHTEDEYESYKMHMLVGKITPSLLELEFLTYLDLSGNNFTTIPTFLGSMSSLRYLYLSQVFFEGSSPIPIPIPHQLGNLSSLRVLDLKYHGGLYVDDLSWITHLHSLEYLDMSWIDLHNATDWHQAVSMLPSLSELLLSECNLQGLIPHQLGNLSTLHHLDLSGNNLKGLIPHQLGNLSTLHHLDLSFNNLYADDLSLINYLYVDDLSWIAGLHSLEYLNMGYVDLHKAVASLQAVSMLPSLSELHLRYCQLANMIPPLLAFVNFTSLTLLDLFGNSLYGQIPDGIGQLKHLEFLSLFGNSLYGPIPPSIGNLSSLRMLFLSNNQLNGTLPKSMGFLSNLESLYVGNNFLAGIVSEVHFATLSKLKTLSMSSNSLFFNVSSNWVPPFQLDYLWMSSCKKIGPRFPSWLPTQTSLIVLDISQSGISGAPPEWLWKWISHIDYINLSSNQINGDISNILLNSSVINLSSNHFEGQLPHLSPNVQRLNLANNSFFGLISPFLCQKINGKSKLEVLDLSTNLLSGGLSDCWIQWQSLAHVKLGKNSLYGKIPNSMGSLNALESLQLHKNNFFGEIPLSLQNCTFLELVDLGENEFSGIIPTWIGEIINLRVLQLRSNKLTGNIPSEICQMSQLTVLDLGNNRLSGLIPKCLNNISAMTVIDASEHGIINTTLSDYYDNEIFYESLSLIIKGRDSEYKEILEFLRSIDLSGNNLSGSIPDEFFSLHALQFLNLSRNQITGKIPKSIGGMTRLESFDLSRNNLSGEIPQSISNLTFLNHLDFSYNNFSGRIPTGTQLQTFDETSYIGNAELCGTPLNNNCTRAVESQGRGVTSVQKEEEEYEMVWFYIAMGLGFAVGFWVVCGTLLLKRTWRHAYFQLLDDVKDWIYLAILLKVNWLCRKFKRSNDA